MLLNFGSNKIVISRKKKTNKIKLKKTTAKTGQTTKKKRLRYTAFQLANTSLHQVYYVKTRIYKRKLHGMTC